MAHQIREYTHADVEDIKKILVELQEFERLMDPNRMKGLEIAHEYLEHLLELCKQERGKIFVVEINGGIVGMISVYIEKDLKHLRKVQSFATISDSMVLPEYRDEGITKELLLKAEEYALSKGVHTVRAPLLSDDQNSINGLKRNGYHSFEIILRKNL